MKMRETSRGKDKEPYGNNNLFLNPERASMPDIDSDFRPDIREKCIEYCEKRYGKDNVCRIMTKTYNGPKGSIRLGGRYLASKEIETNEELELLEQDSVGNKKEIETKTKEIEKKWYKVGDDLCKFLDEKDKEKANRDANQKNEPKELYLNKLEGDFSENEFIDDGEGVEEEFIYDGSLESLLNDKSLSKEQLECLALACDVNGIYTTDGEHAAGVIISKDRIDDTIPLKYNSKADNFSTQCVMSVAESLGLLKMDFLGLKNLTIVTNVLKEAKDYRVQDYSLRDEILNDPAIFRDIYCKGNTLGIFQFESPGMTNLLKDLQPDCFEDIIAAISLYRPGPMDFIPQYIEGKRNPEGIKYICPEIKKILEPTYGTIVYQEQVMQIFQYLAGYSLGGADNVRKAISKKMEDKLLAEKPAFIFGDESRGIEGCIKKVGITEQEASDLFDSMVAFGKYAFNKSHATAYAMVSLFTAYCKQYHPTLFYKEVLKNLSSDKKVKQMDRYVAEMQDRGITLEAPSIMTSQNRFTVSDDKRSVYFGFAEMKGMSNLCIDNRTECLQEFIQTNPNISQTDLLTLARLGCFKTLYKGHTKQASIKQCKDFILANKPRYDKLLSIKSELLYEKQEINSCTDDKDKEKLIKSFKKHKATYESTLNDIKEFFNANISSEDKDVIYEKYRTEKELCFTYLSPKDEARLLPKDGKDFSSLKDVSGSQIIPALVVNVSDEKQTKSSGSIYYNVDLMDKNGRIITRRFATPPVITLGYFNLQPDSTKFFMSKPIRPLNYSNVKTVGQSFGMAMRNIKNGSLSPEAIKDVSLNNIGNGRVELVVQTTNTQQDNNKDEREDQGCEVR